MENSIQQPEQTPKEFSYCFWGKLLVAIPVIPLIAVLAALQFETPLAQVVAGAIASGLAVYAAFKVDEVGWLSGKIVKRKG